MDMATAHPSAIRSDVSNEKPTETKSLRKSPKSEKSAKTKGKASFFDVDYNELDRNLTPKQQREWTAITLPTVPARHLEALLLALNGISLREIIRGQAKKIW